LSQPILSPVASHFVATIVGMFALLLSHKSLASEIAGRASTIDGDTLEIHSQRVRRFGIDAPESRQTCEAAGQTYRCDQEAALALSDHIGQRTVDCEPRDTVRAAERGETLRETVLRALKRTGSRSRTARLPTGGRTPTRERGWLRGAPSEPSARIAAKIPQLNASLALS
jgi:endonuclease YncB( thermonuclease family)